MAGLDSLLSMILGKTDLTSPEIKRLKDNFDLIDFTIDEFNDKLKNEQGKLAAINADLFKNQASQIKATGEYKKKLEKIEANFLVAQRSSEQKNASLKNDIKEKNKEIELNYKTLANDFGVTVEQFKKDIKELEVGGGKLNMSTKNQIKNVLSTNENFSAVTKSLGMFSDFLSGNFISAINLAVNQMFDLNNKLVENMRNSGGVLSSDILGFNNTGSNNAGSGGSLATISASNGLSSDEFLKSTQAFNQGNIFGGTDLKGQTQDLQNYGVQIGRLTKFYGLNDAEVGKLTQTLTQQYGKSISQTTDILKEGAEVARNAGVNVKTFFTNLSEIADLQNQLFVKGGPEGLEKTALALTKLGLSSNVLPAIENQYKTFGNLIGVQQKMTGLALNNTSAVQERVFAKLVTGDKTGALKLRQTSIAKDLTQQGFMNGGEINTQGLQLAQAAGYSSEEISSIRRLGSMAEKLGVSFNNLVNETGMSNAQLKEKRAMEYNELKWMEKINKLGGQLNSLIVDPLMQVLGPTFDIIINVLSAAFDVLGIVLYPVTVFFKVLGKVLGWASEHVRDFADSITKIKEKFDSWNPFHKDEKDQTTGDKTKSFLTTAALAAVGFLVFKKFSGAATTKIMSHAGELFPNLAAKVSGVGSRFAVGGERIAARFPGTTAKIISASEKSSSALTRTMTGATSLFKKFPKTTAGIGSGIFAAIGGAANIASVYGNKNSTQNEKNEAVGSGVGGVAGAIAGGALGTFLLGPGLGTIIGETLGQSLGEWGGGKIGGWFNSATKEDYVNANIDANKKSMNLSIKTVSLGGTGGQNERIANIMNAKRLNNDVVAQGQAENAAFKTSNTKVVVNVDGGGLFKPASIKSMK